MQYKHTINDLQIEHTNSIKTMKQDNKYNLLAAILIDKQACTMITNWDPMINKSVTVIN